MKYGFDAHGRMIAASSDLVVNRLPLVRTPASASGMFNQHHKYNLLAPWISGDLGDTIKNKPWLRDFWPPNWDRDTLAHEQWHEHAWTFLLYSNWTYRTKIQFQSLCTDAANALATAIVSPSPGMKKTSSDYKVMFPNHAWLVLI